MLQRFRAGQAEPLIFGDNGQPEGVVVPFDRWEQPDELAADAEQAVEVREVRPATLVDEPRGGVRLRRRTGRGIRMEPRQRAAARIGMTAQYHLIIDL
jgi:hypothetical protein